MLTILWYSFKLFLMAEYSYYFPHVARPPIGLFYIILIYVAFFIVRGITYILTDAIVCPTGWTETCSSCVKYYPGLLQRYPDAVNTCSAEDADLAIIKTEAEANCICNYLQ